jgi:NADPH:quinone reductase-like Zn-dependent oxidoreductase
MKKWLRWIGISFLAVLVIGLLTLGITLSHDDPCGAAPALAAGVTSMKAVVRRCYGPPDVLAVESVEKPVPANDQILVRVRAFSVNPFDWHYMRGSPYLARLETGFGAPKNPRLGVDFAGTIEAVGKDVSRFKPGDDVFGGRYGAFAEYVTIPETGLVVAKPANSSFEQAAGVNIAAVTALQALRDGGHVGPGRKVLINGASGGVGTFAVQIAKELGAEVTGVCSTRNVELVRSLGADHVIDYTKDDFTQGGERYDVVMDNVANRNVRDIRRVLSPGGKYLVIGGGGPDAGSWVGPFVTPLKALVFSWFVKEDMGMFMSHGSAEDLGTLRDLMRDGKLTTVVDRTYPLARTADAMRYLEAGHARGKVVVVVD